MARLADSTPPAGTINIYNSSQSNSGYWFSVAFRRIFRFTSLSELNIDAISDILEF
jgi:hypothetical protein